MRRGVEVGFGVRFVVCLARVVRREEVLGFVEAARVVRAGLLVVVVRRKAVMRPRAVVRVGLAFRRLVLLVRAMGNTGDASARRLKNMPLEAMRRAVGATLHISAFG